MGDKIMEMEVRQRLLPIWSAYRNGTGVEKDPAEAVQWYRKAAVQGFAPAQLVLGRALQEGIGVKKDEKAADEWFQKAAAQGNKDAIDELTGF